jgi:hypothetical protein
MGRSGALRLFAFAVPVSYYAFYFAALKVTQGLGWSVHLWTGSIVLAGVIGLLLSYLIIPPTHASLWLSPSSRTAEVSPNALLRR